MIISINITESIILEVNTKCFETLDEANQWFDDLIHKSLYAVNEDQKDDYTMRNRQKLSYKVFNQWDDVNIERLGSFRFLCLYMFLFLCIHFVNVFFPAIYISRYRESSDANNI